MKNGELLMRTLRKYKIALEALENIAMPDCEYWDGCGKKYSKKSKCFSCQAKEALTKMGGYVNEG